MSDIVPTVLKQANRLLDRIMELEWQLEKEREHNAALLNELARYRDLVAEYRAGWRAEGGELTFH